MNEGTPSATRSCDSQAPRVTRSWLPLSLPWWLLRPPSRRWGSEAPQQEATHSGGDRRLAPGGLLSGVRPGCTSAPVSGGGPRALRAPGSPPSSGPPGGSQVPPCRGGDGSGSTSPAPHLCPFPMTRPSCEETPPLASAPGPSSASSPDPRRGSAHTPPLPPTTSTPLNVGFAVAKGVSEVILPLSFAKMGARGVGAVGYSYRPKGGPGRNGKPAPRPADWSFPHPAARAWDGAVFPTGQGRGGFTASREEERPTLSAWAHTSFPPRALPSVTRLPRQSSPSFPTLRANLLPASDTPQSFFWWSLACPLSVCPVCQLFGSKSSQGPRPLGPL